MGITNGQCEFLDLAIETEFPQQFDWIMSLEVGEHIPAEYEDVYIANLDANNANGIVLSWAVEGQGGKGHVNCHNNDYIKDKFKQLGYSNDLNAEKALRSSVTNAVWFKNTENEHADEESKADEANGADKANGAD